MNNYTTAGVYIRWAILSDIPAMLAIEEASFDDQWTADDFKSCFRDRSVSLQVAERGSEILGFFAYLLRRDRLELLNLAVRPDVRRRGIGRMLLAKIKYKLSQFQRERLALTVGEWNLSAQVFFRTLGFRAVGLRRDYHPQGCGYRMEFRS